MKRRLALPKIVLAASMVVGCLTGFGVSAKTVDGKTKVTIAHFDDKTINAKCSARKSFKGDLGQAFQLQMIALLTYYAKLRVLNLEIPKDGTPLVPQYAISGAIRSFDQCAKTSRNSQVALEVQVIDTKTGELAFKYVSNANVSGPALSADFKGGDLNDSEFKTSALGMATHAAMSELAFRVDRALADRKPASTKLVSQTRNLASSDYMVKLIKKNQR